MNAKVNKRRFWAAILSIAAILAMTVGGLGGSAVRSVYAADGTIEGESSITKGGSALTLTVTRVNTWSDLNNFYKVNWSEESTNYLNFASQTDVNNDKSDVSITVKNEAVIDSEKTVTIIATWNGKPAKKIITVKPAATPDPTITFSKTSPATIAVNEAFFLTANISNYSGSGITYSWTSSDSSTATVVSNENAATITGIKAGTSAIITVTATIPGVGEKKAEFTVNVSATKTLINESSLPAAYVNRSYSAKLTARSAANDTYTWSLVSGTLPTGLTLKSDTGEISGTPTAAGSQTFTIRATSTKGNGYHERAFTITVGEGGIAVFDAAPNEGVTPNRPANLETVAQGRADTYSKLGGSGYSLYFPVVVKSSSDNSISGKSKIVDAISAVKNKATVHYIDITPTEEVTANGKLFKDIKVTDTEKIVEIPFTIPSAKSCVVLRVHDGTLLPMARMSSRPSNPTSEGYYYKGSGELYIYARYYSTFAIIHSQDDIITVSFDTNGGSHIDPVVIEAGGSISTPSTPTRSGYRFDGWFTNSNLTTEWTTGTTFNTDATVYARWTSSASTDSSTTASTTTANTSTNTSSPRGTTPTNSPQTGDTIDYVRAFAAMIVVCAGALVLLYALKVRRRK
ncbi:MAG: InlB B-repeat-containing protein [Lachnospiraceae bacterium]|nr:InlB B-repeat-containing protein [Lachnospiraceae bacterium]